MLLEGMKMDNAFKRCYTYQNITCDVTTTNDIHDRLQNGM